MTGAQKRNLGIFGFVFLHTHHEFKNVQSILTKIISVKEKCFDNDLTEI